MQFDHQTTNVLIATKCGCVVIPPPLLVLETGAEVNRNKKGLQEGDSCVCASVRVHLHEPNCVGSSIWPKKQLPTV